jgi:hypothetical protein
MHSLVATSNTTAAIAAALLAAGMIVAGGTTASYIGTAGRTASGPTDSGHTVDGTGTGTPPTIAAARPNLAAVGTLNHPGFERDSGYAAGASRHTSCGLSAGQVS